MSLTTTERVPDDATVPEEIWRWLKYESGISPYNIVFWAGSSFRETVASFANANGYSYYWGIFNGDFAKVFGDVNMDDREVNIACSKALGLFARDPLVFGHDDAPYGSYWIEYELPLMWKAGTITKLRDDAMTAADTYGVVPIPDRPGLKS